MELNRIMILFSGCFLLVWSTYKWKRPYVIWDAKLTRVYSVILGLYNMIRRSKANAFHHKFAS